MRRDREPLGEGQRRLIAKGESKLLVSDVSLQVQRLCGKSQQSKENQSCGRCLPESVTEWVHVSDRKENMLKHSVQMLSENSYI